MSADVNLSGGACGAPETPDTVMVRVGAVRAGTHRDISNLTSDEQFLEVAGFDRAKCKNAQYDMKKLDQDLNDIHVAEMFSQPNGMTTASRMGLTDGLGFRHVPQSLELERSCGRGSACIPRGECFLLAHQCANPS